MKNPSALLLITPTLIHSASAITIANWKEFNPNAVIPLTNADTNSPVYGDGSANSAQAGWVAGQFGTTGAPESVTLAIGDTLTVSGGLTLTGGTNNSNQVRFGVFNDGGQFTLDSANNWTAGWLHVIGSTAGSDLFLGRTDGAFISTGGNASDLDAVTVRSGLFDGDSATPFAFSMTITRDSATTVDVVSLFTGGDGNYSEQYVEEDAATANFTYTTAGALFGGSSGVDQANFSNVQFEVTTVPEPSAAVLGLTGLTGLLLGIARRRRQS